MGLKTREGFGAIFAIFLVQTISIHPLPLFFVLFLCFGH
jgi:hypothetical protein